MKKFQFSLIIALYFCSVWSRAVAWAETPNPFTKASFHIRAEAKDSNGSTQTPWATIYIDKDGSVKDVLNTLTGTFDFGTQKIEWGGTHQTKIGTITVTTNYSWVGKLEQTGPKTFEGSGTYTYSSSTGLTATGTWKVMSVTLFPE